MCNRKFSQARRALHGRHPCALTTWLVVSAFVTSRGNAATSRWISGATTESDLRGTALSVSETKGVGSIEQIVDDPDIGDATIEDFARDGFVRLRRLFTHEAIDGICQLSEEKLAEQAGGYAANLSRVAYRLHETTHMQAILRDPRFGAVLRAVTGTKLIPCEAQAFELASGTSGIPWHYGFVSFGYVRARDLGYTLWIPLSPIDAVGDGGGMAYVPESVISARHGFDMGTLLAPAMNAGNAPTDLLAAFADANAAMQPLFEEHKVEHSFDVGDALLFNKYVWHRSSPYRGEGEKRRLGIALRFVGADARMDRTRWTAEFNFGGGLGIGTEAPIVAGKEDRFARFVDVDDGDLISSSPSVDFII